jgi:hypothetical protein
MIEDEKYYNITELSQAKLHPFNNSREYISKMVNEDYHKKNLLNTIRIKWNNNLGYNYKILGKNYKNFIAMRGYLND